MSGRTVHITQKAGVDGRLFGSVTNNDIAEALTRIDFKVVKSQVRLPNGPLKTVGEHVVTVGAAHRRGGRGQGRGGRRVRLIDRRAAPAAQQVTGPAMPALFHGCALRGSVRATTGPQGIPSTEGPPGFPQTCPQGDTGADRMIPAMAAVFTSPPLPNGRPGAGVFRRGRRDAARRRGGAAAHPAAFDRGRTERARRPAARQQRLGPRRRPAGRQRLLPLRTSPDLCGDRWPGQCHQAGRRDHRLRAAAGPGQGRGLVVAWST